MSLDILTFGEALVEVMRTEVDQPLHQPALFTGPYPSGAPFIFAVQSARLGATVSAIGAIGQDAFGRCLIQQLEQDGVDIRGVRTLTDYPTGVAFVAYASNGLRDFVFHIRSAAAGQLSSDMLNHDLFVDLKCLHLMGSTLSIHEDALQMGLQAVELAKKAGAIISFDPNLRPQLMSHDHAGNAFQPIIEVADILIPTEDELKLLTRAETVSDAVDSLFADKPERLIVMTQGKAGCTVFTQSGSDTLASFPVSEIDPTGAGDCFDAGFLVQWLKGNSPKEAARFANACGALAVTQQGPMAGAHTLMEVEKFIRNHP